MKKLYTTLIALLIATTAFAQVQGPEFPEKTDLSKSLKKPENFQRIIRKSSNDAKSSVSFTYDFLSNAAEAAGVGADELSGYYIYTCADANASAKDHLDGDVGRVSWGGMGQVFDFAADFNEYDHWALTLSSQDFHAPNLKTATSYSLDTVHIPFRYHQGTEISADVVDTLIITYLYGLEGDITSVALWPGDYQIGSSTNYACFSAFAPHFNPKTFEFDQTKTAGTVVTDKILLTSADRLNEWAYYSFPTPDAMHNISGSVAVYYSFVPGNIEERDTNTTILGVNANLLVSLITKNNFMAGYAGVSFDAGSYQLANDWNTPLASNYSCFFNETSSWYSRMIPTRMWVDNSTDDYLYPDIAITITCNDCDILSVKDIDTKKNITVRPNPATNQFTIDDLDGNGTAQLQLFNLVGQLVYSDVTGNTSATVNVSNLNSGVYVLKITQNGKISTSKVIVR